MLPRINVSYSNHPEMIMKYFVTHHQGRVSRLLVQDTVSVYIITGQENTALKKNNEES